MTMPSTHHEPSCEHPFENFPWPLASEDQDISSSSSWLYGPRHWPSCRSPSLLDLVITGVERAPTPPPPPPPETDDTRTSRRNRLSKDQWHAVVTILFTILTDAESRALFAWSSQWISAESYAQMYEEARQHGFFSGTGHWRPRALGLAVVYRWMPGQQSKVDMFFKGLGMLDKARRDMVRNEKNRIVRRDPSAR